MHIKKNLLYRHYQWDAISAIYDQLNRHGFVCYLAGGCVRDALLNRSPKDMDIATNATPEQVEDIFVRTVSVGKSFGVIRVLTEGADIEVATFRQDGAYKDGRHPEEVQFTNAEEDAKRRDFTVNALFYDIATDQVIDYVNGISDLQVKTLRTVGDPELRFSEDYLRMLRALRFSAQLDFAIENQTLLAIQKLAAHCREISPERIHEEISKILLCGQAPRALNLMHESRVLQELFPSCAREAVFYDIPTFVDWKKWVLFFLTQTNVTFDKNNIQSQLTHWKFSNAHKKQIQNSLWILSELNAFFTQRQGELLKAYAEESTRWALEIVIYRGGSAAELYREQIQDLHQTWLRWGEELPKAFLGGHDVAHLVHGPKMGECLRLAYLMQLEGQLTTYEEALAWAKDHYAGVL